jgi:hypothetical protein
VKHFIIVTVLLMALLLPGAALAQDGEAGIIEGQVVNDTAGGGSVAGAEVTLITYVEGQMAGTDTVLADDEGGFRFTDIDLANEYLIAVSYQEVDYYYPVVFDEGESEVNLTVGVCEVTGDDAWVRIGLVHILIDVAADALEVTQVYWLVNEGDTTFVGEGGGLVFTLPEGATGFAAPEAYWPDFILTEDNRAIYLVPFPPGERQLYFSYRLPRPDADEFQLAFRPDYATDVFDLMVGGGVFEVASGQLAPAEPVVTEEGARYIHFRGENLPQGGTVTIYLTDTSRGGGFPLYVIWIILALIIVGLGAYLLWRRGRGKSRSE